METCALTPDLARGLDLFSDGRLGADEDVRPGSAVVLFHRAEWG